MTANETGWMEHARAQRAAWANATPEQRLRWLDEALRFAQETGALARSRAAKAKQLASLHDLAD